MESNADKVGAGLAGIALGGVAAHAIVTNIRKRRLIKGNMDEDYSANREDTEQTLASLEEERKELIKKADILNNKIDSKKDEIANKTDIRPGESGANDTDSKS